MERTERLLKSLGVSSVPQICYAICATPRSGSALLCNALTNSKVAGDPREYFLTWYQAVHEPHQLKKPDAEKWLLPAGLYVRQVIESGSRNNVFGVKMMAGYLDLVIDKLRELLPGNELTKIQVLRSTFPNLKFIHLIREDKIRQAVSLEKAIQSNKWHRRTGRFLNRKPSQKVEPENLAYDFEKIAAHYDVMIRQDKFWKEFFQESGIKPLEIHYELFIDSYQATILHLLDFLEIQTAQPVILPPPGLERLSDSVNDEWAVRFKDDLSRQSSNAPQA